MWLLICWILSALAWGPTELEQWATTQPNPQPVPELAEGYEFTGSFFGRIAQAAHEKPGVIQIEKIGQSTKDRPILAFHIRNPATPVTRKVLVFGGIHALEWISTEVTLRFLDEIIRTPPPGILITVIPLLNPDGRARVERDLMERANRYRRGNEKNVDLNRDFAVNREAKAIWKAILPKRYKASPGPLSQPETQALDILLDRERYHRAASLHAFGGFFYYPWSGLFKRPPHHKEFVQLGRTMEWAMAEKAYKTRQLSRWGFFFRAHGSEIDHIYGKYSTKAFLIEVTRSGLNPFKPKTFKTYFRWYNPPNSEVHRKRVSRSLWALTEHPTLPSEEIWPPEVAPSP